MKPTKIKSTKHFFYVMSQLKKKARFGKCLQPDTDGIKEQNRIQMAVNSRVRWELGPEGYKVWRENGHKDYSTLARAYGIK